MGAFYDITGNKYGRLIVIKRVQNTLKSTTRWLCKCDCGKLHEVNKNMLVNGSTESCGCYAKELIVGNTYRETHNQSRTRLYHIWQGMKQRCYDKNTPEYHWYGGNGVTVCDDWMRFEGFYEWSNRHGYDSKLTIDRINNYKGYSPENCKWSTIKEQNRNKRYNRIIELNGVEKCMGQWCEELNIPMSTVFNRLRRGWSDKQTLNTHYDKHVRTR